LSITPEKLPVYQQKEKILDALKENQVIIVESPTGSGKTTQLPLILHSAGYSKGGTIGVTQPRRIAALSVSDYIARQIGSEIPGEVGYKMRFDDQTLPETRIKIMTDGILLQEMKADRYLSRYSSIIVDEAHERSLNIDFILGLLKQVLEARKDFKVVVSSATINPVVFSEYFNSAPIIHIDTRIYPIKEIYEPLPERSSEETLVQTIVDIVRKKIQQKSPGDVLVFLQGERNIKECVRALEHSSFSQRLKVLPLYGRLSKEEQEQVFDETPEGKYKVVVSTNIAETSVTIDGITTVIDSGLAKINHYNPRTFTSSLVEAPISQASCNQRKGRAGRTQPGTCFRLYSRKDFRERPLFTLEEIYRTDLSEVVLRMAELGITDFEEFDFISSPGIQGIRSAVETLYTLESLDEERHLSRVGEMMVQFPLLPRHSRMIVEGIMRHPDVLEEILTAAAFLSANTPFLLPQGEEMEARRAHHQFADDAGDFVSYLKLFRSFTASTNKKRFCERHYLDERIVHEIVNIQKQLSQIVSDMGVPISSGGSMEDYLCAVSTGLIQFVCARSGRGAYHSLTAEQIQIHPGSVMFRENPQYIVAGEIVKTSRTFARSVSPLKKEWLGRISPLLAKGLSPGKDGKGSKEERVSREKQRDTTWEVQIAGVTFMLKQGSGKGVKGKGKKKTALLPYQDLKKAIQRSGGDLSGTNLGNLRGMVVYEGREFLNGEKLRKIVRWMKHIELPAMLSTEWPQGKTFNSFQGMDELTGILDQILLMAPSKKNSSVLGFLTLYSNGDGNYWLKPAKRFSTAVEMSLASLEILIDELDPKAHRKYAKAVNDRYRVLAELYEE
jgi:ATP-dependent helicase HrpA